MNDLLLAVFGLILGLSLGIWLFRILLRIPNARIFLSNWVNWNQAPVPEHCEQLVRHGRWVAEESERQR